VEVNKQHVNFYNTNFSQWDDTTQKATIREVRSSSFDSNFVFNTSDNPISTKKSARVWIKLKIRNNLVGKTLLIELTGQFKKLVLYIPDKEGEFIAKYSGNDYPFHQREFKFRSNIFELPYSATTETYYLSLENYGFGGIGFRVQEFRSLFQKALPSYFYSGLFFGLLALALIYNFMFYWSVRENTYLFYCGYILMMALFASVDMGYIFLVFYNLPFNNYWFSIPFGLMTIFLLLYTKSFFTTKSTNIGYLLPLITP